MAKEDEPIIGLFEDPGDASKLIELRESDLASRHTEGTWKFGDKTIKVENGITITIIEDDTPETPK